MYRSFVEKISDIYFINDNLFYLNLSNTNNIDFEPGHCFSIKIPNVNLNREYSVCSIRSDNSFLFLIRKIDGGLFTNYLLDNLKVGDSLQINGPYGEFFFPKPNDENKLYKRYFLISTGTGIAPYISYIKKNPNFFKNITLLHGIRLNEDIIPEYKSKSNYIPCVSQEDSVYFKGRVTDCILIKELNIDDCFYLCGNRMMISECYDILVDLKKIPPNNIISETFF